MRSGADNGHLDASGLRTLLERVAAGEVSAEGALASLRTLPFEDVGFARLDHHRGIRTGCFETVYCAGKTAEQVATIVAKLAARCDQVLGTRATPEQYEAARKATPGLRYHELARTIWLDRRPDRPRRDGVALVAAGTSDLPVAEEAALTLDLLGHRPLRLNDVGVAGLHRILGHVEELQRANVVIVVAGMEGALSSVVGGLTPAPVVAVPTSVGYGASFGGIAALLGMLNSCSPGVSVVNIDNGFGAAVVAAKMNARIQERPQTCTKDTEESET